MSTLQLALEQQAILLVLVHEAALLKGIALIKRKVLRKYYKLKFFKYKPRFNCYSTLKISLF
jgi:hypothetical protein